MNNIFFILILIFASTKIKGKNICLCIYGLIGILVLSQFYDGYCNYVLPNTTENPDMYTLADDGDECSGGIDESTCNGIDQCFWDGSSCSVVTPQSDVSYDKMSSAFVCNTASGYAQPGASIKAQKYTGTNDDIAAAISETSEAVFGGGTRYEYITSQSGIGAPVDYDNALGSCGVTEGPSTEILVLPECGVDSGVTARTCANVNGDGLADDPYDCSATSNVLVTSPESVACPPEGCTETECCPDVSETITCGADFDCSGESNALNPDATCAGDTCTATECCTGEPREEQSTGNQTCQQFIDADNNSRNYCKRYNNAANNGETAGWKYELPFDLLTQEAHHADLLDIAYERQESNTCTNETCFGGGTLQNTNDPCATNNQSNDCKDFKHDQEMCCKEKMPCYIHFMNNLQACPSGYEPKPDVTGFDRSDNSLRDTAPRGATPEGSLLMYENIASKNNYGRSNHLCDGYVCDTDNSSSRDTPICCMKTFNCRDDVILANQLNKHLDGFDETPYPSLAFFDDVESIDDMCTDRNGVPASSENEAWENVQQRLLDIRNEIPGKPNDDGTVSQPVNVSPQTIANDLCSSTSTWYFDEGSTTVGKCCTAIFGKELDLCSPKLKIQSSGQ